MAYLPKATIFIPLECSLCASGKSTLSQQKRGRNGMTMGRIYEVMPKLCRRLMVCESPWEHGIMDGDISSGWLQSSALKNAGVILNHSNIRVRCLYNL